MIWQAADIKSALRLEHLPVYSGAGISIDTRHIAHNDIFIGISGQNNNGGIFAKAALASGASLCIVNDSKYIVHDQNRFIILPDTNSALLSLAKYARARFNGISIAITGSVGKTSSKDMLATIFQAQYTEHSMVHYSYGSYNNHYGVPITLANTPPQSQYAIFEAGMNAANELTALSALIKPNISIITNVKPAHLEAFNSIDEIAHAKAEIFHGMQPGSTAILDLDSEYLDILLSHAMKKNLIIGGACYSNIYNSRQFDEAAVVQIRNVTILGQTLHIRIKVMGQHYEYTMPHRGLHFVKNSALCIATATALGADIKTACASLNAFTPCKGRGTLHKLQDNITIIDDSYNANPASMEAAIEYLGSFLGRKIAVLADMKELGPNSSAMHADLAKKILACNIDRVYTAGVISRALFEALPANTRGGHFADAVSLYNFMHKELIEGDTILIKGSNSMNMSKIVDSLLQEFSIQKS